MLACFFGISARLPATQPFDKAAGFDSSRENAPLTKTNWQSRDSANVKGSMSRAVNLFRPFNSGSNDSRYGSFRIGPTFVYFHSSLRVVGKSSDSNAAPAFSRRFWSHAGSRPSRAWARTLYAEKKLSFSLMT